MNDDAVERIRAATFPSARKGYDRVAVDAFLDDLAETFATGGEEGDEDGRGELVRRELERIGESTTAILTEAHDAAETIRRDAEQRIRQQLAEANLRAEALQGKADDYAERVREEADAYARKTRTAAETFAREARERAQREAQQALEDAQRRRADVEQVVTDLEERRDAVIEQLRRLVAEAGGQRQEPSPIAGGQGTRP